MNEAARAQSDAQSPPESEVRARTLVDHAPVLLWMADENGLCNYVNQGWLDFTGRTLEEQVQSGRASSMHAEDSEDCTTAYLDAFAARRAFSMEYRLRRSDGEFRWVFEQGSPRFEPDGTFAGYIGACTDITEQHEARDALGLRNLELEGRVRERTAIAHEREVLLREVHHRVKNDLQLISSVLAMQGRRLADPQSVEALNECQSRVQTIALIHEYMYQSDNLARLPLSENIRGLAANLLRAADPPGRSISLEVAVEDGLTLPVDRAIPCGLILNELMTNAIKHAFPDQRRGTLRITLRREGADELLLGVADDGIGMPGDYANNVRGSLGWRLVKAFADQLGAYIRVGSEHGTNVEMVFRPEG